MTASGSKTSARPQRTARARLSDDQRNTLVRQIEHWFEVLSDMNGGRAQWLAENGLEATPERLAWCDEEAAGWYEIARRLRLKEPIS